MDNLSTLADKLEPLAPDIVQHWRAVRDSLDSETRSLLDNRLKALFQERLGDPRNTLLLSLPPRDALRGEFSLGRVVYGQEHWPVSISRQELTKNLAVLGGSGSGKTNIVLHLLRQIAEKRIPFLFLDWKRNARQFLPSLPSDVRVFTPGRELSPFAFNPLIPPPGVEQNVFVNLLTDIIAAAYTLGEASKSVIQKALTQCYADGHSSPSVSDVLSRIDELSNEKVTREWKMRATRALESIEYTKITPRDRTSQEEMVSRLLNGATIVELDGLTDAGKKFLIPILTLWIYHLALPTKKREELSLVLFLEEAHNIFSGESSATSRVMSTLIRMCRELGIAMVVVDQTPSALPAAVLGNCYTSICLNLKDPADRRRAAGLSLMSSTESDWFSRLPVGHGVVKLQDRWSSPILVHFPLVEHRKGAMDDETLSGYLKGRRLSALSFPDTSEMGSIADFRTADIPTTARELLRDISSYPVSSVSERYKRLKLSGEKGNRYKNLLIEQSFVSAESIATGSTHKLLLRLTDRGRTLLNSKEPKRRESDQHAHWKALYAKKLAELGYKTQIEAPRARGAVDVAAFRLSDLQGELPESIAVEVETGSNNQEDLLHNVREDLAAGYTKVIVVATDEQALEKAHSTIEQARLALPKRVRLVLRDKLSHEDLTP